MAVERVDPATARAMQRAGDTVIDVRSPEEYASGHIAGAQNIPLDLLPKGVEHITGPILTACSMGGRAGKAAERLSLAGREAYVIDGGTKAWEAAGLPVERRV